MNCQFQAMFEVAGVVETGGVEGGEIGPLSNAAGVPPHPKRKTIVEMVRMAARVFMDFPPSNTDFDRPQRITYVHRDNRELPVSLGGQIFTTAPAERSDACSRYRYGGTALLASVHPH